MRMLFCLVAAVGAALALVQPVEAGFVTIKTGSTFFQGGRSAVADNFNAAAAANAAYLHSIGTNPLAVAVLAEDKWPVNGPYKNGLDGAKWVSSTPEQNLGDPKFDGYYAYSTSLGNSAGVARFYSLGYRSDNNLYDVLLNGKSMFTAPPISTDDTTFDNASPEWLIEEKVDPNLILDLVNGENFLTFIVRNKAQATGNPQSLLANVKYEFIPGTSAVVPVPAAAVLFAFGLPCLGLIRRKLAR